MPEAVLSLKRPKHIFDCAFQFWTVHTVELFLPSVSYFILCPPNPGVRLQRESGCISHFSLRKNKRLDELEERF